MTLESDPIPAIPGSPDAFAGLGGIPAIFVSLACLFPTIYIC